MYVALKLHSVDHPAADMEALTQELYQVLGVSYDALLLQEKNRKRHVSWAEIHTSDKGVRVLGKQWRVLEAIRARLPEVQGATIITHVGGIAHDFDKNYPVKYHR